MALAPRLSGRRSRSTGRGRLLRNLLTFPEARGHVNLPTDSTLRVEAPETRNLLHNRD